jgi:hypothetical protein
MAEAANPPRGAGSGASAGSLRERMDALGRELAARESEHTGGLASATEAALALHDQVSEALDAFHAAAHEAGAPQLAVVVSAVRVDDKHLRAVQFDLRRGRHAAIVTVKTRGEVILVGPFQQGKDEGPCRRFPVTAEREIEAGLGDFLTAFLNQAATP